MAKKKLRAIGRSCQFSKEDIDMMHQLIKWMKSGEVRGIAIAAVHVEGVRTTMFCGNDAIKVLGALECTKHRILTIVEKDESVERN